MRGQLGCQTAGILAEQAPVEPVHHPAGIAVPLRMNVRDVSQHTLVDQLLGELIELAVAALESHLEDLLGVLSHQWTDRMYFLRSEHQALLAERMLAGL